MTSGGPSSGSETVDLLYLLAKDYSAFSRNERVQWYAEHIVHKDYSFKVRPEVQQAAFFKFDVSRSVFLDAHRDPFRCCRRLFSYKNIFILSFEPIWCGVTCSRARKNYIL
jgi:hypothetical protein